MLQERREKEAKQKTTAVDASDNPESKEENSDSKEDNPESKDGNSEAKAESDKEAGIDLRPLTMEDLKQAKNQVS